MRRPGTPSKPKKTTPPALDVAAFKGRWVAIDPRTNKVIGHGSSLEEARQSAPNFERDEPVLYFVPKSDAFFVGLSA